MEVSQTFNELEEKLNNASDNLDGYYKTFNNCREQGLMLTIHDNTYDNDMMIWACECRNSDKIMVIIADPSCCNNNDMFDDVAYKTARYFKANDYYSATNYVFNIIRKQFNKSFLQEYNNKFKMHKCLADLQRIEMDASELTYEDYYDLATFENENEGYFCDLIISEGKLGLRYSKYEDEYKDEFENLTFEEWHPDLTSDVTLMLGMQNKLQDFIDKEITYDLEVGIGI